MILCGIDLGTSSVKVSMVDAAKQTLIHSVSFPEQENEILSPQPGFAEQDPNHWWYCVQQAILKANASGLYDPSQVQAIGISYQMHGLVLVDRDQKVLRNAIIWCDSRATPYGEKAYESIGKSHCQSHLLNSPGNFTAAKLAWVKENEPEIYAQIDQVLLPGDFIALRLTGQASTSPSALSEGIFWDFKGQKISQELLAHFGFDAALFPKVQDVFSNHGKLLAEQSKALGLHPSAIVAYKAGDQPNNALSLAVLEPGDIATTAGTSGVVYGVSDQLKFDPENRVNSFAHVNHDAHQTRIGVLMCINGTGILNRWLRQQFFSEMSYDAMNANAMRSPIGSKQLICLPFGNGAERIFQNRNLGASFQGLDFNQHGASEIIRAAHEGIAFSMAYGIELMGATGIVPKRMKAGHANMYLSPVFTQSIVNATDTSVDLLKSDGAMGAALGAGVGSGYYNSAREAMSKLEKLQTIDPNPAEQEATQEAYAAWKAGLAKV